MKKIVLALLAFVFVYNTQAQAPQGFTYQAVIQDIDGNVFSEQNITLKTSILQSSVTGNAVYSEEHVTQTNSKGLVNLVIGEGTILSGNFSTIPWESGPFFLKLEIDADGGNNYIEIGTSQLLSVPYALYSEQSAKVANYNSDTLFVVKDNQGNVVFAVFPDGAKVYVNETNQKGPIGGFAVSGRNNTKGEYEVMRVTPDSTRIYVNDAKKGPIGGFAVSGRNNTKAGEYEVMRVTSDGTIIYVNDTSIKKGPIGGFAVSGRNNTKGEYEVMKVTPDSTRIFVNEQLKGPIGGFAVSGRNSGKNYKNQTSSLMRLTSDNYLIGHQSGSNITTGTFNSFLGYQAGMVNTTGNKNVLLGYKSGFNLSSGSSNVFIGNNSGYSLTEGLNNVMVGDSAGYSVSTADYGVYIGQGAGKFAKTGNYNTVIGYQAGYNLDWAGFTTAVGYKAGFSQNSGQGGAYFGHEAGINNIGRGNAFFGSGSGNLVTEGEYNVMVGSGAGSGYGTQNTGSQNVYLGNQAGWDYGEGNFNVGIGKSAGYGNTGSGNVFIGYKAGGYIGKTDSLLFIDNSATISPLIWGDFANNQVVINGYHANNPDNYTFYVNGAAGGPESWNSLSDVRLKKEIHTISNALEKVMKLRGVNFKWKAQSNYKKGIKMGFIAQEAIKVIPELVSKGRNQFSMQYAPITALLVEAIKQQEKKISNQEKKLEHQQKQLKKLLEKVKEIDILKKQIENMK